MNGIFARPLVLIRRGFRRSLWSSQAAPPPRSGDDTANSDSFFGNLPAMRASSAADRRKVDDAPLLDGDAASHAIPVVVGAAQIVGAGRAWRHQKILGVAGLHYDLAMLAVEHVGIIDL
jgi:hypothetical protein